MRESVLQRWCRAVLFGLLGGFLAYWSPVDRLEAHLGKQVASLEQNVDTVAGDLAHAAKDV